MLCTIPVLPHSMRTSCVSLQLGESLSNILPRSCISPCPHVPMHCAPPLNISQHISTYLEISHHISNILPTSFISLCPHVRVHSAPSQHAGPILISTFTTRDLRFCLWTSIFSGRHWWHSSYYNVWTISSIYQTSMDGTVFSISEALTLDHFQSSDMCFLPEMQIETVILILCIYAAESYRERKPIPGFQRLGRSCTREMFNEN